MFISSSSVCLFKASHILEEMQKHVSLKKVWNYVKPASKVALQKEMGLLMDPVDHSPSVMEEEEEVEEDLNVS